MMTNEQMLQILKRIPPLCSAKCGTMIGLADVRSTLSVYGVNDHRIINEKLKELEKSGHIKLVYLDSAYCKNAIIGFKMVDSF